MGKIVKRVLLLTVSIVFVAFTQATDPLNMGDEAPEINRGVATTSGNTVTLSGVAENNGLVVIFSCNTCPWVAKWESRYNDLANLASQNDIGMIVLNPNERIRNRGESMDDMRKRAQKQSYNFTYALDEDHIIADAFGANFTPEVFLFDADLRLAYHGAIDDNADNSNNVNSSYLEEAMRALGNGESVQNRQTQIQGCTIKRTE
ncbi:MAG: redoxin domain-containing protein [Gracilimonas sp.]